MRYRMLASYTAMIFASAAYSNTAESAPTTDAAPPYDVLGIKLTDPIGSAQAVLASKGFQKVAPSKGGLRMLGEGECTSKSDFMTKFKNEGLGKVSRAHIGCQEEFEKAGYKAYVYYKLAPGGFVVTQMNTSFESPETRDQIVSRLTAKFGPPTKKYTQGVGWLAEANPGKTFNKPMLTFDVSDDKYKMSMNGGYDMENALAEQISIELGKALGRSTEL